MTKKIYKSIFMIAILASMQSFGQSNKWAVGLKVGEPLALNIRRYFADGERAFDLNLGTYGFLLNTTKRSYRGNELYTELGGMVQGIYLYNRTLGRRENINVYYGFGGQINSRPKPIDGTRERYSFISLGPAGNAGLEIFLPDNDLSIFLDGGGYIEIVPKFLFTNPNLSVGLRLNINRGE